MKNADSLIRDDTGSISALAVILMALFMGFLAYVIDLGHLHTVHNELRNAADACALRGARSFLPDSIPVTGLSPIPMDPDPLNAKMQAHLSIGDNRSDNVSLTDLPTDEIEVGIWNYETSGWLGGTPTFTWPPDSSLWGKFIGPGISLPTKRDGSHNSGPVGMTLAQIFGKTSVAVTNVRATAALSGVGGFTPGSPTLPFGPMKQYLSTGPGPFHGTFRNDNSDTIGWSNLNPNDYTPNASELKKIMNQGALYDCPMGSEIGMQNGVDASVIQAMTKQTPLNHFGLTLDSSLGSNIYTPSNTMVNPAATPPGTTYAETVYMLPVYDAVGDPDKFNHAAVVGAVPVKIVKVATSPDNYIDVQIVPGDWVVPGYGGGPWYGILATEPKLVQ